MSAHSTLYPTNSSVMSKDLYLDTDVQQSNTVGPHKAARLLSSFTLAIAIHTKYNCTTKLLDSNSSNTRKKLESI